MGRAYEVRKASIQKTGAIKAKTYSLFAKEIYLAAKGNPDPDINSNLKRIIEKAKKNQVPNDIIDRAIKKAKGPDNEDYQTVFYEGFGPGSSTIIVKCLTDNINRTIAHIRAPFNKVDAKLGVTNSVSYNYDHLAIISFKTNESEKVLDLLIENNLDIFDFEEENGYLTISVNPTIGHTLKDVIEKTFPNVDFEVDEVGLYPKDRVTLDEEDLEKFKKLYELLDEVEDVSEIYHNVLTDLS